ncbi:hypothetical protein SAMD00019534_107950, partial [Acytostelium subglobosum LB1]|uniref:hypothetical protein n=1 Tax=Acytostelium subglobosum LB1 TaxID=1410327 RepID=UPI000644DF9C
SIMIHKYRFLIRNLPTYPSRSRDRLLALVKEEVDAGIKEILRYKNLDRNDQNWVFHL